MNRIERLQAKLDKFEDSCQKYKEGNYDIPPKHLRAITTLKIITMPVMVIKPLLPWATLYLLIQILDKI